MSIRKDVYQLDIQILTEETKKLGKINTDMKALQAELRKTQKAGGDTSDVLRRMAASGKQIEKLDLSKVAPQQLITRSRALATAMKQIPASTPAFKAMEAEQKKINDRLATMRSRTRGVADATDAADGGVRKFGNGLKTLMATGLVALIAMIGSALVKFKDFAFGLSGLSEEIELMDRKADRVFGDMEGYVDEFAEANAESLGLTERRYKDVAAAISDVLVPLKFSRDLAAEMAVTTANLGGKLAEWAGASIDAEDATERVRKALLGETEGLEVLGIKINESVVNRKLQERGLQNLTGSSLDQAKALATLELIQEKSNDATAQFGENQDTAARATARNKAQIEAQREEMAERMMPILEGAKMLYFQLMNVVLNLAGSFFDYIARLKQAGEGSKNFQKIIGVTMGFVIGQIKAVLSVLSGLGETLINIVDGEWTKAFNSAKDGFVNAGKDWAGAVVDGYQNGIASFAPELPEIDTEFKDTNTDFDAAFSDIKINAIATGNDGKGAEEAAKVRDKAFKAALAQEEAHFAERKLLAEANFFAELSSEEERDELIRIARAESLQNQLDLRREYGQLTSLEEQKIATELAQQAAERRALEAEAEAKRLTDDLEMLDQHFAERSLLLREAFLNSELTKEELAAAQRELERERLQQRLQDMTEAGELETDVVQGIHDKLLSLREQDLAAETAIEEKRRAELKKTQDERIKSNKTAVEATADMFGAIADLLSQNEKAEKKNKQVIKALRTSEITINGVLEISKIWATYAANPIVAGILTGAAVARTALGVSKVNKAAKGGIFGGNLHSNGGNRGVFQDGTEIEVERDELFMVVNRRSTDLIQQMGGLNAINGYGIDFSKGVTPGRRAERGSLMSFKTTPRGSARVASADAQGTNIDGVMDAVMMLIKSQQEQANRPIKTYVALDDFEGKQGDRDYVASRAAL